MSLIRVLEIPKSSGTFHFGGGEPQKFVEVDWFRDDEYAMMATPEGRDQIATFIQGKRYFDPKKAYLVLHETNTFTINYKAP